MALFEIDANDRAEDAWDGGLIGLIVTNAEAIVVVEGMDAPVSGTLTFVGGDRFLGVDQRDEADTSGSMTLVPIDRVVSVQAPYRLVDREAERRAQVEGDEPFLGRVLELAEPLVGRVRTAGLRFELGGLPRDLLTALRDDGFDYELASIAVALEILDERGDLPPASPAQSGDGGAPR